mgnify:CR=1 FL=1
MKGKLVLKTLASSICMIISIAIIVFMTMMLSNITLNALGSDFKVTVLLASMLDIILFVFISACIF